MPWATLFKPFLMPVGTVRRYSQRKFFKDLFAGLTVSVVEVPQAMAYAVVAGIPPQYGLYTSVIQGVIGALLSSSEHMTTGPTNTQSLLIASTVSVLANPGADPATYLRLVVGLTLVKGMIQLGFAAAQLGSLVRYVSRSVIVGLAGGAGLLIALGQVPRVLGVDATHTSHRLGGVLGQAGAAVTHIGDASGPAVHLTVLTFAIVLGSRAISKLLPGALLAVVVSAVIVWYAGWDGGRIALVGPLPGSFPGFAVPRLSLDETRHLLGGALALAVLGLLESVAIAKSIAVHTGERISANQEFFAQGLKNTLSSFFWCMPGSGSFTRSALDHAAGAETRFAAVFNALFVAMWFLMFGTFARLIPMATLGAILIVIGVGLIDWRFVPRIARTNPADAVACLVTFAATLLLPLEYAIFVGIGLSLLTHLRTAGRLHLNEMVIPEDDRFMERPLIDTASRRDVVFLQLEGDLFFAVADELQDRLMAAATPGVKVAIIRLRRTHSIDASALQVLDRFSDVLRERGGRLLLCGVHDGLFRVLDGYGLIDRLGSENVFRTGEEPFASSKRAVARARDLIGHSLDVELIHGERDPDESLSYYI